VDVEQVIAWLRRIINLDFRVFEEVRTNPTATIPGVIVASAAILLSGLGGWFWWLINDYSFSSDVLLHSAILGSLVAIVLWGVWLVIVYVMLTQIFRQRAYLEQLLRVMGLASCPLAISLLMFIPEVSFGIGLLSLALTFGLTTIAIKTVTSADMAQVVAANAAGFLVWAVVLTLLSASRGSSVEPHAPGVFLYNTVFTVTEDLLRSSPAFDLPQ
jgi:hypothetical protein